jgi:site-specific recombinase XerD
MTKSDQKISNKPIIKHLTDFLEFLAVEKGLSNKSQETYNRFINKFFKWLKDNNLENLKPHELNNEHIWKYRVFLSKATNPRSGLTLKKTSQNQALIGLRNLLNYFADRDILSLPSEKIKLSKKSEEKSIKFLQLDQVEKLLLSPNVKTITGLRDRCILEVLFSTGMRVAELISLNVNQIHVSPTQKNLEISIVGKGGHIRPVYFSERALYWLKKYLNARNDDEEAVFIHYKGPTYSTSRLTTKSIENIVKKYAVISGVPIHTVPHTLRHSFATDLLGKGVDIRTVQEFLGHKSIMTTQIYTHVVSKKLKDIHNKFHSGKDLS